MKIFVLFWPIILSSSNKQLEEFFVKISAGFPMFSFSLRTTRRKLFRCRVGRVWEWNMKISLTLQPLVRRKNFVSTISTFSHHKEGKKESATKSGKTKRENATLKRNRGEFHFPLRFTVGMMRESEEHKKSPWQCWGWILDASSIHSVAIVEAWRVSSSVRAKIKIRKKSLFFSSPWK